jgi:hypothetical protein
MEQNVYTAGQQDFNLPHDVIQLPSGGIFYASKKKSIKVGYLTAVDENIIAEADFKKSVQESIVLPLLRNKIYERDLRPEELVDGDVEAILLFLRNTSFGPEYSISSIDPATDQRFTATIMLDELNIKQPKHKPNEEGLFETTLPISKDDVKLKILTVGDKIEIDRILRSYPSDRVPPSITTRLQHLIVEINGDRDKGNIATYIQQMPIGDSKYIRKFMSESEPRLDLSKEVIAPSGEKVVIDITFGVEFFRPFLSV